MSRLGLSILLGAVWGTLFPAFLALIFAISLGPPPYFDPFNTLLLALSIVIFISPFCVPLGALGGTVVWVCNRRMSPRTLLLASGLAGVILGQVFLLIATLTDPVTGDYPHPPLWKEVSLIGVIGGVTALLFAWMFLRLISRRVEEGR